MSKQLFKGIKSVLGTTFAGLQPDEKKGYIWFVRTVVETDSNPEEEGMQDANVLTDDIYDIYFGTKHYGHFQEGQFEAIDAKIKGLSDDISDLGAVIAKMAILLNLNEDYTKVGEYDSLLAAFNAFGKRFDDIEKDVQAIEDSLENFLVKDVIAGDKVLTVADGILSSTIGLKYESNRISLVGKEGEEIAGFDASEFVKDSVLENVEVTTKEDGEKYITFTWKGDDIEDVEIKVSDFAKLYNAGTALELAADGVTFNVKVAANNNFLSVNTNNELIVDDVTTDKTMIKEAITIKGGPLANVTGVKEAFKDGVIPAGTDIQAVLKALLCVEIYPTASSNTPSYTASISAPTITAKIGTTSISSGALVEVGQSISFDAVTAKQVSTTPTNPKVSGLTHGYSDTIDGEVKSATTITGSWTIEQSADAVYKLEPSKSNFTGDIPASASNATYSACQVAACTLTAIQGTNTYSVKETAPEYVGDSTAISSKYIVSNLGGRSEEKKSTAIAAKEDIKVTASSQTGSFSVTGTYPMYTNGAVGALTEENKPSGNNINAPVNGDGTKLALMNVGSLTIKFASQSLAPYQLYIPQPLGWKISKALYTNPLTGKVEADATEYFKKNGTTTRTIQNVSVTYDVWEWKADQGADFVTFTVAKQ